MSLRSLRLGLRRLFRRDIAERELSDEVADYLEQSTNEHMRRGLSREAAARAARLEFGSPEAVKDQVRDGGWESMIETIWRDVRYGLRGLRRNPTFTLATAITLALGIGTTTAMFSVVNGIMLRPFAYPDSDRLMFLWTNDVKRGLDREETAYSTIVDWQRENTTFEQIAFFTSSQRATLGSNDTRERTETSFTSANLLPLLGVPPLKGRWLTEEDERNAQPVAVISHALWQRRFASNPDIVGKPIELEDWQGKGGLSTLVVVGVMPAGFTFPDRRTEVWVPATTVWRWSRESTERFPSWARRWIGIGRLKPDVSAGEARADLARIGTHLAAVHPSNIPDFPGFAVSVVSLLDRVAGTQLQLALWLLMAAVTLVLLVACANVGNLLLARGAARQHEMAVRRSLGASRLRLVRQLFVESMMLALIGGALGVAVAAGATRVLSVVAVGRLPRLDQITIDLVVLAFAAIASIVSGALFGLLPALRVAASDASSLKDAAAIGGGRRLRRTRAALVVVECGIAVVLLVGAGLLLRSLARVHGVDPGFDASQVLLARIEFPGETRFAAAQTVPAGDPGQARATVREQAMQDLLARLEDLPDVVAAGFVDDMFIDGQGRQSITFPGRDASAIPAGELTEALVTPGLFAALRVPLKQGRYLERHDAHIKIRALWTPVSKGALSLSERGRRAIAEPVVVNEAFVRRFLPGQNPIGERFCIDPTNKTYWYEIVGVVADMRRQGLERAAIPQYYGPYFPAASGRADLLVRTEGNPVVVAEAVRDTVSKVFPGALLPRISTADADLGAFSAERRLQTWLLTLFASLALVLAAIGIYGVVHYGVAQRTREIGVRMALGAQPRDVVGQMIAEGMRWPLLGMLCGLVIAIGFARVMSYLLFEVGSTDVATFAAVTATLIGTALVACYAAAARAARIDAVTALRLD